MFNTCPKCGYTRKPTDSAPVGVCPGCGLIFEKYLKARFRVEESAPGDTASVAVRGGFTGKELLRLLLAIREPVVPAFFWLRCLVFLGLFVWGWRFIFMDYYIYQGSVRVDLAIPEIGNSFMHLINLPFHEAGHVLFRPFGWFMMVLGGSLMQLLIPLIVLLWFLLKEQDTFGAHVGLWWLGQSLMDLAPYINDARRGQMLLLGGHTGADSPGMHDWANILGYLGISHLDHRIAGFTDGLGVLLMLLSFVWGGLLLYRQYRHLPR